MAEAEPAGKRVSWVELYFDVIFVFAVGQVSHVMVGQPAWSGVVTAIGLFITLWWSWIGFVVLYNRHAADTNRARLFVLLGTIPCAIAAVSVHGATTGDVTVFALALAGTRLLLVIAYPLTGAVEARYGRSVAVSYGLSTVFFAVSAVVPAPWRYVLWGLALLQEVGVVLFRRPGQRAAGRPTREESLRAMVTPPTEQGMAFDVGHLAERFGLFMIILLGEVVISVTGGALDVAEHGPTFWLGLVAGLVLAGAAWWLYFDAAAEMNEYALRASGGNPTMAYAVYAGGHFLPAFALLVTAAGINLSLHVDPPRAAPWLLAGGLAAYLTGTRVFEAFSVLRLGRILRLIAIVLTVGLASLARWLPGPVVVAVAAAWTVVLALLLSSQAPAWAARVAADPLLLFGRRR